MCRRDPGGGRELKAPNKASRLTTPEERAVYWKLRCKAIEEKYFSLVRTLHRLHQSLGMDVYRGKGSRKKDRLEKNR